MRFGPVPVSVAEGAVLAHSQRVAGQRFKKGRVLNADDVALLKSEGIDSVIAARLDSTDVDEDTAASTLAAALTGRGLVAGSAFTGRCNLSAVDRGVLVLDADVIDQINLVDEAITVATLPKWAVVDGRQMVATIKIIPFAVSRTSLDTCLAIASRTSGAISVPPLQAFTATMIQTRFEDTKTGMLDKTTRVMTNRVESLGGSMTGESRCAHDEDALAEQIKALEATADIVLIAGASAIVDRRDVIPAAIEKAGGQVQHFGMPVDPGNLLLLATLNGKTVLGLPGCARSPKYNGLDAVLERFAAGIDVNARDVMGMGVGGLLKEFSGRPTPRSGVQVGRASKPRVEAVVLAAGQSRRMGEDNKLLARIGDDMMVQYVMRALCEASVERITVVTGHEADEVKRALEGFADSNVRFVFNPAYAEGLSTSLAVGIADVSDSTDAVVVCLGDMPLVSSHHVNQLIAAFDPDEGREICLPVWQGKRGNPVLWSRRFIDEMKSIRGDTGARHLVGENEELVCEVAMQDPAALIDVDTPEALAAIRSRQR